MSLPLHEMIEGLFGIKTTHRINRVVNQVQDIVTQILMYDPKRVGIVIVNLSVNAVYISTNNNVTANNGIFLAPLGGAASLVWDRDFELCCNDWYAIAAAINSNVFILENLSM